MKKQISDAGWFALMGLLVLCVGLFTGCGSSSGGSGSSSDRTTPSGVEGPEDDHPDGDPSEPRPENPPG